MIRVSAQVLLGIVLLLQSWISCTQEVGLSPDKAAKIKQLRRFDGADPLKQLESDLKNEKFHFLAVYGYSLDTPEIANIEYEICFKSVAGIELIDPTSDMIVNEEHERLKGVAGWYAAHYNEALKRRLFELGKPSCAASENWRQAWWDLRRLAEEGLPHFPAVGAWYDTTPSIPVFSLLLTAEERVTVLQEKGCSAFLSNGIKRKVRIELSLWLPEPTELNPYNVGEKKAVGSILCNE